MVKPRFYKPETLALHAGQQADPATGARAVPIYQTTSYAFTDSDTAAALYNLELPGHIYSRISNPTVAVLEERLAALEGGVGAVCTSSGMAALHLAIATLLDQGAHIVASRALYGGSVYLLRHTLPRFGITTTFVDPTDADAFRAAIRPETRLIYGEVLGNPGLDVMDVPEISAIAHAAGLPMMVDSTFTPPVLFKPFEHGVDIVIHSATKFIGGHGIAIGGVMIDAGNFDWHASGKFPTLTAPYDGYGGLVFAEEFGPAALIMRARSEGMRDFGCMMAPQTAFYLLQGLETLPIRIERHIANTRQVIEFLQAAPEVAWVNYPELDGHPGQALAKRLLPKGCGSIFTFGITGGRAAGARFVEALQLVSHLANVGDAKTLAIHPASTTHQQMSAEALETAGIGADMIRLSIGLENAGDIIADLKRALHLSQKETG